MKSNFEYLLSFLHCKILNCKRVEDRRWTSLPVVHKCALVVQLKDGRVVTDTYDLGVDEQRFKNFLGTFDNSEVSQAALLVDCYNFKKELSARVVINITAMDSINDMFKLSIDVESGSMKVEGTDGLTNSVQTYVSGSFIGLDHAPTFWFDNEPLIN